MERRQDKARIIYARLLRYSTAHWKAFAAAIAAMAVVAAANTSLPILIKPLIDGSFVQRDPRIIAFVPLAVIVLFLVRGIADFVQSYCMSWVGRQVIRDLRREMFDKLLRLPVRYYDSASSGELLSKLVYNVEQVNQAATNSITNVVREGLTIMGLLAWMIYINWMLTLVFIVVGPLVVLAVVRINKRFRSVSRRIQNSMAEVTAANKEAIDAQRVIKIFSGHGYETARFSRINEANSKLHVKMTSSSAAAGAIIEFIAAVALAGIIYLATRPAVLETVTIGAFMSFVAAMLLLMPSMKRLTSVMALVQRGVTAAESIFDFIDQDVEEDKGAHALARAKGAVEFRGLSFGYAADKGAVLHDIDLRIEPGQCVAFVGRSGSGKSTLVSLVPRFYDPLRGAVLLDGHDIRDYKLAELRAQIAWVGQDVVLFNDDIAHNIAYGALMETDEARIVRAAGAAHAMEFISRMPDGLKTVVGDRGVLLSGGQRQRIAIARALLKDAPILILDEATSALDSESERHIQEALAGLMRNRTTLVIAHRLSTVEHADLIVVLDEGRIVERGTHQELLALDGHYAALHRLQFQTGREEGK